MRFEIVFIIVFTAFYSHVFGQGVEEQLSGEVSYVTSKSIYVKFENTEKINVGDTLRLTSNNSPCLVVTNKSSRSCVCLKVNNCKVEKGDKINHLPLEIPVVQEAGNIAVIYNQEVVNSGVPDIESDSVETYNQMKVSNQLKEKISGRFSVSSYSTFSSIRDDRHRLASRFSFNIKNISDSKFSFSSYFSYRQNFIPNNENSTRRTLFFNVFEKQTVKTSFVCRCIGIKKESFLM